MSVLAATSLLAICAIANGRDRDYTIDGDPAVLNLIRTADQVFVFPVVTPLKPHRDDKHMRLLGAEARQKIARLLTNPRNWVQSGGWSIIYPFEPPRDVGLLFRRDQNELILFFNGGFIRGTFNGEHTEGAFSLDGKRLRKLEEWKLRYARPEISEKT
jgi:hypothetical protein